MGMAAGSSRGGPKNEINVTPLVDVCLVLLIIFMVVTPMLQRGQNVKLPQAHNVSEKKEDTDPLILSVTKDKKMFLDKTSYDEKGMQDALSAIMIATPTKQILLKGDAELQFGEVRKVMQIAQKSHAKGIQLGVEQLKDK